MLQECQRVHSEQGAQVYTRTRARVCVCAVSVPVQKKEQRNADHAISLPGKPFGKWCCCSKPQPDFKKYINKNSSTILRHSCSTFLHTTKSYKQQAAGFSTSNHLSRLLADAFSLQSGYHNAVSPCCPGKLHLLPAIWGAGSADTLRHSVPTSCWLQTCPINPPTPTPQIAHYSWSHWRHTHSLILLINLDATPSLQY